MNAHRLETDRLAEVRRPGCIPFQPHLHTGPTLAREPESAWEAKGFADLVPPDTLSEARAHRDELSRLLRREREAAADFLLALADFDRRRGWERLGHASVFAFLTRELGLSNSAAWYRQSAAALLPRFPAVEAALRAGRLCLSVVGDLARVLTPENEAEVLPRFLGTSSREAKELVAAMLPQPCPPKRDAVTVVRTAAIAMPVAASVSMTAGTGSAATPDPAPSACGAPPLGLASALVPALGTGTGTGTGTGMGLGPQDVQPLLAPEVPSTHPARERRDEVVPLTAELRRLSVTVSARFLSKLTAAREGLSHARPRATTEQVLEAALDLLLEQQARRKALVKRPREVPAPARSKSAMATPTPSPSIQSSDSNSPTAPPPDPRAIPAAVEREVRLRDGDRCQFPLDSGGVCGSAHFVQLDHLLPVATGGLSVPCNLRCACAFHNRYAGELALGPAVMEAGRRRSCS